MMALAEVRARDLRLVCLHEFAHQEVARHFGFEGHVRVHDNPSGGFDERFFGGRFFLLDLFGKADPRAKRLIALAGKVAETLDDDPDLEGWELIEWLDYGIESLSDSDAVLAEAFDEQDIDECIAIVLSVWHEIERHAAFEARCWPVADAGEGVRDA